MNSAFKVFATLPTPLRSSRALSLQKAFLWPLAPLGNTAQNRPNPIVDFMTKSRREGLHTSAKVYTGRSSAASPQLEGHS